VEMQTVVFKQFPKIGKVWFWICWKPTHADADDHHDDNDEDHDSDATAAGGSAAGMRTARPPTAAPDAAGAGRGRGRGVRPLRAARGAWNS